MTDQPEMNSQQVMQMFQQKLGNLELTVHSLLAVLEEEDIIDQDTINEKAQEIVEEMQQQQQAAGAAEDLADELEDDEE